VQQAKWFHFTVDADWVPGSALGLVRLLELCERRQLKGTVFFTGRFAQEHADLVRQCHAQGLELGTHGWEHGSLIEDEDFRVASYADQQRWVRLATDAVEAAAGVRPTVFRAPSLMIGETTLRVLEEEGYRHDSSIPVRRHDLGFGRVHYVKYFFAPTEPYHPSSKHMGKVGNSTIIEVPPSALVFPINMAALHNLQLPVIGWMVKRIARLSSRLVFYSHPYEFVDAKDQTFPPHMSEWTLRGMQPQNLDLLEAFVDYVLALGYTPTVFSEVETGMRVNASR
jgi:peptidoglycan/xylan/chitin deacetylase (PgdA/CDA1 family)